ncbi:unnamed protein product, partial [Notodromas monacha]
PKGVVGFDDICLGCYEKEALKTQVPNDAVEAPAALTKRLRALADPNAPPPVVVYCDNRYSQLKRGLSKEDAEIVNRLAKLQEGRTTTRSQVTDDMIAERLQRLRSATPSDCDHESDIPLSNKRQPAPMLPETAEDLIKRVTEEVNIVASCQQKAKDHVEDIAKRLRQLGRDDVGENVDGDSRSCRTSDSGAIDSLILDKDVEAVAAR